MTVDLPPRDESSRSLVPRVTSGFSLRHWSGGVLEPVGPIGELMFDLLVELEVCWIMHSSDSSGIRQSFSRESLGE